jgi:hypothetical protein
MNNFELAVFPASSRKCQRSKYIEPGKLLPNAKQEAEDIRLFLFVELGDVFVGPHLVGKLDEKQECAKFVVC